MTLQFDDVTVKTIYCFFDNIHGTSRQLRYESVGRSLVEVYEKVGKAVISFRSVKGPKRADRRIFVYVKLKTRTCGLGIH